MVKRLLLLSGLLFCVAYLAQAQLPPSCGGNPNQVPPAESCPETCIYCNFANYMGSSAGYAGNGAPPGGFCAGIQNDQWLGFIAGASSATFTIIPSNCTLGDGVQVALYEDCNTAPLACNGGCAGCGTTPSAIAVAMIVGTNYYLLIDGYGGDECDLTISVSPITAVQAPPVGTIGNITGPSVICPGATGTYQVPTVTGAGAYTWSSTTSGVLFNGEPSPAQFDAPGGRVVQVTFPSTVSGKVTICVNADNSCSTGSQKCKDVTVQPIPATVFPKVKVCQKDLPYTLPWGDEVNGSGTFQTTLTSFQGCDSVLKQEVKVISIPITSLGAKYVCEGGSITVCGTVYNTAGFISETCTSYQNCDSVVTANLFVLEPVAEIIGGGTLSCTTQSIALNSAASPGNTIKIWRKVPGSVIGNGNSVTVNTAGTYTLTSTITLGGTTCVKADTIVIDGNTTPPIAGAVTNGFIGCGGGATSVSGTSSVPNSTYAWGPPLSSNLQTVTVTNSGTYTVTVTSALNGCTATASTTVTGNTTVPTITTTGGTLTCAVNSIGISASSSAAQSSYLWTGPAPFSSTLPNPNVTVGGIYTVTVTNTQNSCTATATASVGIDDTAPTATATVDGIITCPTPVQSITTGTNAVGPTYAWSPPLNSTAANPSVGMAGTYTVTITATGGNGCTATASATITGDTNLPNVSAQGDTVSCGTPSINLTGNSTTPGVTFAWTGPNNFSSTLPNPPANSVGIYTLTVTAQNQCKDTATATIEGDFVAPTGPTASGGIITCSSSSTTITSSSTTSPVTYDWDGPGNFDSDKATASATNTGIYTVTFTSLNGCTATATAEVAQDSNVPDATADGGTINCINNTVVLDGGSTTPGVTLSWTGPAGFPPTTQEDPTVTIPGIYTLTVSNPVNGCSKIATANVNLDKDPPTATATGETLTCTNPTQTLLGSSPVASVTWSWNGPDPTMPSTQQNPTATTEGFYTLTVSDTGNGCTSTAVAELKLDKTAPVVASTTGTLTCAATTLILDGSSTLAADLMWTGPSITLANQHLPSPTVSLPGDYTLLATATINGCTGTVTVKVDQDIAPPGAAASNLILSCTSPQGQICAMSPTGNVNYSWKGPGVFSSPSDCPTVSVDGSYTVTVTSVSNGCTSTAEATVGKDTELPNVSASSPDLLTCSVGLVTIQADATNGTSAVTTYQWIGPGINGSNSGVEDPSVDQIGVYVLTATSANGCSSTSSVTVAEDKIAPDSKATSGELTCLSPIIPLNGTSATQGVTYAWSGPNGFNSIQKDTSANAPGVYTVTVTNPVNGCTSTAQTTMTQNIAPPGATTAKSDDLDCSVLSVDLQGGPGANVTYQWTTGGTPVSTDQNPTVAQPGTYILLTTSTINGCTSTSSVVVTQDIQAPDVTAKGVTLDCITGTGTITAASQTAGVSYKWEGPNSYSSKVQNPNDVTNPGTYTVTVTAPNGCSSTATAEVLKNTGTPQVTLSGGGLLTCAQDSLTITATIGTPGATFQWSGPGGTPIVSTSTTIDITQPGTYGIVVTNPVNGCKASPTLAVIQNILPPQGVTATGGKIDCTTPTISIKGGTSSFGVTYQWEGPGSYTSAAQNPNDIKTPGVYTVTVTRNDNGCTATATANVTQDPTVPTIDVTTEVITCKLPTVVLQATTSNPSGVTWDWSGPDITAANKTVEDPSVTKPGSYSVVVKANSSGCTASFSIDVAEDVALPGATAQGDTLTCLVTSIPINSSSPTAGVTYQWQGPDGAFLNQQNPNVSLIGTYTVTVTAQNGCTSTATAVVAPDKNAPQITAGGGTVTCLITTVTLEATTNTPVQWFWTGPGINAVNQTQQNPTVTQAGNYTVRATAANGCSVTAGANVFANTATPDLKKEVPKELNCTTTQVNLGVSVQTPGTNTYTYAWGTQNGAIVSGGTSPAPTVSQSGQYVVTVTNTQTGCSSTAEVTVLTDPATPSGAFAKVRDVSCFGDTNGAIRVDSVKGGTPPFLYSLDNKPLSANVNFGSLPPGPHLLLIQDANGCEFETTLNVQEPEQLEVKLGQDTTIHLGDILLLNTDNIVNFPDRVKDLQVKPADVLSGDTLRPVHSFRYTVTAVDSNGCKATDDRIVIVDKTRLVYIPNIFWPESPNGNELLRISVGQDVAMIRSFQIYDRWGSAVYEKTNFLPENPNNDGWDGRVKGDKATPAVFVYYAEILFKDGEVEIFKGDVTLYR